MAKTLSLEKKLTPRLEAVASLAGRSDTIADIGTDHAYVPIFLLKEGAAKRAYLCDVKKSPVERAKKNALDHGVFEMCEFFVCDGTDAIDDKGIDVLIIAGMGAETIVHILSRCAFLRKPGMRFILQPMTEEEKVRKFLKGAGQKIIREAIAKEGKNIYVAMEAQNGENDYSEFELFWGRPDGPAQIKRCYFEYKIRKLRIAKSGMERSTRAIKSPEYEKINALISAGEKIMREQKNFMCGD